jgi:hypothetical protein
MEQLEQQFGLASFTKPAAPVEPAAS